jgi:predicted RNA-binding Zn-ribbon protein involved in translation (DUF1610 family)
MRKHYAKAHPGAMKRRRRAKAEPTGVALAERVQGAVIHYCPNCGIELNPCYGGGR